MRRSIMMLKLSFQVSDKENGGATVKWTTEYEKINNDVEAELSSE